MGSVPGGAWTMRGADAQAGRDHTTGRDLCAHALLHSASRGKT